MAIPEPGWEEEGRRLSPLLDTLSAVVVIGGDERAAALVAVGAAQAQSERRRVVIGDLVGDLDVLEAMIPRHDPHGLADSFTYGISLNRIGYAVEQGSNLYIMPSGSEPVATAAIIGHSRWQRLVAGFREVGALLVLVAHSRAPALSDLVAVTDGALLIADTRLEAPAHVIARARPRGPAAVATVSTGGAATPLRAAPALVRSAPASAGNAPTATATPEPVDARASSRRTWAVIGMTLAAALVAIAGITVTRILDRSNVETAASGALAPPSPERLTVAAPAAEAPPPVENPGDSARAARYSVVVVAANTAAGANDNLRRVSALPGATSAPSIDGGALWYKVFVGAFTRRADAEALRDSLRAAGPSGEIVEPIVVLPFAVLAADALPVDSVTVVRDRLAASGVATYPLVQDAGTTRLYAGAFTSPDEAMHLAPLLRTAGIQPRIVYRTGRPR